MWGKALTCAMEGHFQNPVGHRLGLAQANRTLLSGVAGLPPPSLRVALAHCFRICKTDPGLCSLWALSIFRSDSR